jgi:hypothetical protein
MRGVRYRPRTWTPRPGTAGNRQVLPDAYRFVEEGVKTEGTMFREREQSLGGGYRCQGIGVSGS